MRCLWISLAIVAAAFLSAAMPDAAFANSQQHCTNQWNASSASSTCTHNLTINWISSSGKCSIFVGCTTGSGGLHNQQVKRDPDFVSSYINCNGFLRLVFC